MKDSDGAVLHKRTDERRDSWRQKPVLRVLYEDYYDRILSFCADGPILEIGASTGGIKTLRPDAVCTDVQVLPWLDSVVDAHCLPFKDQAFSNIIMIDALHHFESPYVFFKDALRVLPPGGRLVMMEPAITPVSWIVFNFMHPEPVDLQENPLSRRQLSGAKRDPFDDANQAIPTTLFGRHRRTFEQEFPEFKIIHHQHFCVLSYLLSGGFRSWSLLPRSAAPTFLKVERVLDKILGPFMAFRLLTVLERT
ncbi:MAG: methyltransferase domain-containing protein [Rhodospirillales bacterium]